MINVVKLKKIQEELISREREEFYENLEEGVIRFVVSKFFKERFTERKARKETSQSARVLNNWEKEGIIPALNPEEGKSRRFNKVEAVWLELVTSCREFGLSLERIKQLRKNLFTQYFKKFTPLEYALMYSIMQEAMILVVFEDGEIKLMPQSQYAEVVSKIHMEPHLFFNLLSIAEVEFPYNNFRTIKKDSKSTVISEKELQLLYFLRTGDFESIKVRIKEGEMYLLEGSKRIPVNSKVIDIIKGKRFQDIEIKTQDGIITHFVATEKVKL